MPAGLEQEWSARGYYGTLSHNAKAVYQKYLGWYDANPANLDPLPPVENARKTVEYMGGADAVIARARADFAKGEYRWVASAMNQVVFADPANRAARELGADALEQLGYQAEAGHLAQCLSRRRDGAAQRRAQILGSQHRQCRHAEGAQQRAFFDYLGVRLNAAKAEGKTMVINWSFTDFKQQIRHDPGELRADLCGGKASAQCRCDRHAGARHARCAVALQRTTFADAVKAGLVKVEGDPRKLDELLVDARYASR